MPRPATQESGAGDQGSGQAHAHRDPPMTRAGPPPATGTLPRGGATLGLLGGHRRDPAVDQAPHLILKRPHHVLPILVGGDEELARRGSGLSRSAPRATRQPPPWSSTRHSTRPPPAT